MLTTSLDIITRRWLLENGLPIHYYAEGLFHAATCLRELSFDSLQLVNAQNLPVNEYGAIEIPADYVDDIAVCIPNGQSLKKLPKQDWITPLRIHSETTGAFQPYTQLTDELVDDTTAFFGFPISYGWFWNVNNFGEGTGGFYGARGGTMSGYKVFKERRQIQLTEDFIGSNVVLLYISDGSSVDNATQIDPQAFATVNAFIQWQRSPNRSNENSPEGRTFHNQRRLLRARLNPLTGTDISNIIHRAYTAVIKN